MGPTIEVDTDELRGCAAALADTSARIGRGPHEVSPLAAVPPGWAAAAAIDAVRAATVRRLTATADAVGSTGLRVGAAAAEYDRTDERAARRLRGAR